MGMAHFQPTGTVNSMGINRQASKAGVFSVPLGPFRDLLSPKSKSGAAFPIGFFLWRVFAPPSVKDRLDRFRNRRKLSTAVGMGETVIPIRFHRALFFVFEEFDESDALLNQ